MIPGDGATTAEDLPIACSLTERELAVRRDQLAMSVFIHRQAVQELPDGYAVRFAGDASTATRLLAFITEERACCPFFTFELVFAPRHGPITLHLRGPEGTKEVVSSLLEHAGHP